MSDLADLMEQYIPQDRYPTLRKFCNSKKDAVLNYIQHFDDVRSATSNLQNKFKSAFKTVRPNSRRGASIQIDLKVLFAEAKARMKITSSGWDALASSVQQAQEAFTNQSTDTVSPESSSEDEETDLPSCFERYRKEAQSNSKEKGFYMDSDLQEILSLAGVLFLKDNDFSEKQVEQFGLAPLKNLHRQLTNELLDGNLKFAKNLHDDISELLREFDPDTESIRSLKERINNLAKQADDLDYILIDILINYCNKLPLCTRVGEEIGEAELQGTYIDPLLYPLFHNPQKNKYYRWLNKQVPGTSVRRPDGNLYRMKQRKIVSSIGYVEIKADRSESTKRHEDMVRLVAFCQETLNSTKLNAITAIQAVGYYISFYHFMKVDNVDLMIELYSFEVPKYISQLSQTLSSFNLLKQVMVCSDKYCVNDDSTNPQTRKRENNDCNLDQATLDKILNQKKPRTVFSSLSFKK